MATTTFAKYQGLGNDFLVLVDPDRAARFDAGAAVALCDRHRGVGADGVLRLSRPAAAGAFRMELRNADGGIAETSGNGLRCAVLAAAHAGMLHDDALAGAPVVVETYAGPVVARLVAGHGMPGTQADVSVTMGEATVSDVEPTPLVGCRARQVDMGNPHLVLFPGERDELDLSAIGPVLEVSRPGGTNVELVTAGGGEIDLVVWERGVGLTLACGSGSGAAAAAAREAGLAGDHVVVHNPGGDLFVELSGPPHRPRVTLEGPACRVAKVEVDVDELAAMTGAPA